MGKGEGTAAVMRLRTDRKVSNEEFVLIEQTTDPARRLLAANTTS